MSTTYEQQQYEEALAAARKLGHAIGYGSTLPCEIEEGFGALSADGIFQDCLIAAGAQGCEQPEWREGILAAYRAAYEAARVESAKAFTGAVFTLAGDNLENLAWAVVVAEYVGRVLEGEE